MDTLAAFYVSVLIWRMFLGNLMEILPGNENLFGVPVRAKPKFAIFLISGYGERPWCNG